MYDDIQMEIINDVDRIEHLLQVYDHSFPRSLSERVGSLREYAQKMAENAIVVTCSHENKIIGYAAFYCNDMESKQAYVTAIVIDETYKGKGVAITLGNFCLDYMKQMGIETIVGEVDRTNTASLKLCKRFGFEVTGEASDCSIFLTKYL